MRLIDADKTVHYQTYDDEHEEYREHTSTIAKFLDTMTDEGCPEAVDAVSVIRCKDCKHTIINENVSHKPLICCCTLKVGETEPEWFCADGERRE